MDETEVACCFSALKHIQLTFPDAVINDHEFMPSSIVYDRCLVNALSEQSLHFRMLILPNK